MMSVSTTGLPTSFVNCCRAKPCAKGWQKEPCRFAWSLTMRLQIVQGLIAAHDRRIVHRDLKPENLFVTTDGRVKILDFGVAKLQSAPEESGRSVEDLTTVTRSGAVVGTVAYMSPEQLRGKAVDHRSDIFSVGAILYEMLTGRRAFRGETEVDTITAVLLENPPEINLEQSGVPRIVPANRPAIVWRRTRRIAFNRHAIWRLPWTLWPTLRAPSGSGLPSIGQNRPLGFGRSASGRDAAAPGNQWQEHSQTPSYRRLTFEKGTVYSARFGPDFRSVVYGAAWNGKPLQIFSTVGDSLLSQPLNLADANLLAISRTGELAVALHGAHGAHLETEGGMLARTPLAGGSPREVLKMFRGQTGTPKGELAVVVHHAPDPDRIEYPIGHVLYQNNGWISHLRFSPQGRQDRLFVSPCTVG